MSSNGNTGRVGSGWLLAAGVAWLAVGAPIFAQTLPGQECAGQTCGLYLQSTQSMQAQESSGATPTPLQPAARGFSEHSGDKLQVVASELAGRDKLSVGDESGLLWLLGGVGLFGCLLLLWAVDSLLFNKRLLRWVRLHFGKRPGSGINEETRQ